MTTPNKQSHTNDEPGAAGGDVVARRLWTQPAVMACFVIAAVVYGSLIPFEFAWGKAVEQAGGVWAAVFAALTSPSWVAAAPGESAYGISSSVSDWAMNLALYVPLGLTVRMALRLRFRHWPIELAGTLLIALALSWGVESLQGLMPARVASLNDVLANGISAMIGALVAPWLWLRYKRLSFWAYCKLAGVIERLRGLRERPAVVMLIALGNALAIGAWYALEVRRTMGEGDGGSALPFERAFNLPYDMGAVLLGQALLVYAGIGCLLLLLTYTGARRLAMNWVVLGVVLLAFVAELSRAVTQGAAPDITGPLLALAAGAVMTVTVYTFVYAVKRSNRRHEAVGYDGPERRHRPHDYA